ncbi:MAG: DUF445 domain-containing protein [Chthoniobacterales bacterium]
MTPREQSASDATLRMRWIATASLVLVFCGMIGFRVIEPWHPLVGYLRAFCEAATVGALADWFAVVALFRHPMGIPIPHTAILPNNKMRVAESLADFIESNFLDEESIITHLRRLDFVSMTATSISKHRADLVAMAAASTERWIVSSRSDAVPTWVTAQSTSLLSKIDVSSLVGSALESLFSGTRGDAIFRMFFKSADGVIVENRPYIQEKIRDELPLPGELLRGLPGGQQLGPVIDQLRDQIAASLTEKTLEKVRGLIAEAAASETHPIRQLLAAKVSELATNVRSSPDMKARIHSFQSEYYSSSDLETSSIRIWEFIRSAIIEDLRNEDDSDVRSLITVCIDSITRELSANESLRATINALITDQISSNLPTLRTKLREHIHSTILNWNAEDISKKLETTVGRDLQFIRLNGTIIGGIIGVIIHAGFAIAGV